MGMLTKWLLLWYLSSWLTDYLLSHSERIFKRQSRQRDREMNRRHYHCTWESGQSVSGDSILTIC